MGEVYKMKGLKQFYQKFDLDAFWKIRKLLYWSSKAYYNYIDGQVSDQVAGMDWNVLLLKTTLFTIMMRLPMNTKITIKKFLELIKLIDEDN